MPTSRRASGAESFSERERAEEREGFATLRKLLREAEARRHHSGEKQREEESRRCSQPTSSLPPRHARPALTGGAL